MQKGNVQEAQKVVIQTSHLGASKLWRSFLEHVAEGFAKTIDHCIVDYRESLKKKKKRKKRKVWEEQINCGDKI